MSENLNNQWNNPEAAQYITDMVHWTTVLGNKSLESDKTALNIYTKVYPHNSFSFFLPIIIIFPSH